MAARQSAKIGERHEPATVDLPRRVGVLRTGLEGEPQPAVLVFGETQRPDELLERVDELEEAVSLGDLHDRFRERLGHQDIGFSAVHSTALARG